MIEKIFVDAFVKELGDNTSGMSRPVHIIGSNRKDYILKTQYVYEPRSQQWVLWNCMFLQEILVYNIAKYLNIPTPDCAIANVEQVFLQHAPSLVFAHRYSPGSHFASNIIPGVENNIKDKYLELIKMRKPYMKTSWRHFFNGIDNKDDIPKIIVLDLLTANFDRFGNNGNLLIASNNGKRVLYVIDHGHCFYGSIWNLDKRDRMSKVGILPEYIRDIWLPTLMGTTGHAIPMSGLGEMFRALDQHIDLSNMNDHCFKDIVLKVEQITPQLIDSWFQDVPDEWFVDKKNQIPLYKNFIMEQKNLLRRFLSIMAEQGAFHSYLGGDFNWTVKRTGTL